MEKKLLNPKKIFSDGYIPPNQASWKGRKSNPHLSKQYIYQNIILKSINDLTLSENIDIGLIGYACDEGVRRNLGRVGTKNAPQVIRENLGKLALHFNKEVSDFGDIVCIKDNMEICQNMLSQAVYKLLLSNIFPIILGGGHDIAYGHFMGIYHFLKQFPQKKISIINFDAHFDLRPLEKKGNSGTPFFQILSELKRKGIPIDYYVIGIQQESNTKELFEISNSFDVKYTMNYECEDPNSFIKTKLHPFVSKTDFIYLTIDLDSFSSSYAPGVSATSSLGLNPFFVLELLKFLMKTKKVVSCDFAELNPKFDQDNITANLTARLVNSIIINY